MDNLSKLPPRCLQSISSFSKSPEMAEMTEESPEKSVKRIEEPAISLKKIAQLEADLEEMKKDKDVEMSRLAANMVQIEVNLKIAKLEADLDDERERNREEKEERRSRGTIVLILRTQNTEVREGKAKIGELEGKINALQSKNSDLETQIQFERENKTAEIMKLQADLNRTMNLLDPGGWSYLAKTASWYKAFDQWKTFDEAVAYCASQKGHLVTIHSQEENDFVQKLAKTIGSFDLFWIELKRNSDKGDAFEWTDESSVDFTNWMVGEPDSNTHAALWGGDGKWGAYPSTNPYRFICKMSSQFS